MEIIFANSKEEAERALEKGFEPVECAFGRDSVIGPLKLDHHGEYSHLEAVSISAAKLALEGITQDKFVVTGKADCDQCYAIAALNERIPIDLDEARAIAEMDVDPIGRDLTSERYLKYLMFHQITRDLPNCLNSTKKALEELVRIFNNEFDQTDVQRAISKEHKRRKTVKEERVELEPGKISLVNSKEWGYDVWYQEAPIVVAYSQVDKTVTLGLCPKSGGLLGDKTGYDLIGQEGLIPIYEVLGPGWGGRDVIGGSPRGQEMSFEDAKTAFETIKKIIK